MIDGYDVLAVRSDTLPPATHTNAVLVGKERVWVIDPGTPDDDEQRRVAEHLRGREVGGVILTHRHRDHVAGAEPIAALLRCDIFAHPITKEELAGRVRVDRLLDEGDSIDLGGGRTSSVLFTPGHARGHIVLWEPRTRAMVVGDMVAGVGSVIISAPDGDVADYLRSLARLRALDPLALYPAHGPVISPGAPKLDEYIAHRRKREHDIRAVIVSERGATLGRVVDVVYATTPAYLRPWALRAASAHVDKLIAERVVHVTAGKREDESVYEEDARFAP